MSEKLETEIRALAENLVRKMEEIGSPFGSTEPGILAAKCGLLMLSATFDVCRGGRASSQDISLYLGVIVTELTGSLGEDVVRRAFEAAIAADIGGGALRLDPVGEA